MPNKTFQKRILEYSNFNQIVNSVEFFCRGAAATDSNKLDWKYNDRYDILTIFVADQNLYNTITILFGKPNKEIATI